jgi:hypothetical protein
MCKYNAYGSYVRKGLSPTIKYVMHGSISHLLAMIISYRISWRSLVALQSFEHLALSLNCCFDCRVKGLALASLGTKIEGAAWKASCSCVRPATPKTAEVLIPGVGEITTARHNIEESQGWVSGGLSSSSRYRLLRNLPRAGSTKSVLLLCQRWLRSSLTQRWPDATSSARSQMASQQRPNRLRQY